MVKIGLLGLGTIGRGIVEIINERREYLKAATGVDLRIKTALVRDINKKRDVYLSDIILTDNFEDILGNEEIDILVEVTGDLESTYDYITRGLKAGKHIVTANKAVVSKYFEEISQLAAEKDLAFLYEASVGGGIPVLKPLREQLALNRIDQVQGILNGTCNYILTRMVNENKEYDEVLKIAQRLGYAEADPTADVKGHDTLRKLRILASLALQGKIQEEDIILYGISNISKLDVENIKKMDSTIKLIAEAKRVYNGFTAIVQPTIVKNNNYFANVNMAFNSISFTGNFVGELKFYGAGAGKDPTANAVLSDCLDIALNSYRKGNPLGKESLVNLNSELMGRYYLRISKASRDILERLEDMTKELLTDEQVIKNKKEGFDLAIITKLVKLSSLNDLIANLGLEKDQYFLAKIME